MNRGAWLRTEEIIECHRELGDLEVIGGVVYGFNPHDDLFLSTHGVRTADYFWKIVANKNDVIAWIIPNIQDARRSQLDNYIVSIFELEQVVGREFDVPLSLKNIKPEESWELTIGCDLS